MEVAPQPGMVLSERYRLVRPLARGGMGAVWCAEHLTLGSQVALKIIDPELAREDVGLARFMREARALAALHSPFIVHILDFGSDGEIVYLVMELLEGKTLGQRLKAEKQLSEAETLRIFADVCKAMGHAHERGVVHRDLKPDNIFLCDASREHITKVLDFGIAKPHGLENITTANTSTGMFLGTPSYMSPEQCRGQAIDQRSDLWALGAIAFECLTGKRLYMGSTVGDVVVRICSGELPAAASDPRLPAGFRAWLERAMAREPEQRFASASELFVALSGVLGVARPARGIDSAETLAEPVDLAPLAPASAPAPDVVPGTGGRGTDERGTDERGTVERGALARTARRSRGSRWISGLAAAAVAAALALALVRGRPPPPAASETRAESLLAASGAAALSAAENIAPSAPPGLGVDAVGAPRAAGSSAASDAGAQASLPPPKTPAPAARSVQPRPERRQLSAPQGPAPSRAADHAPARAPAEHEMEPLRRTR
jgi:eukaryotic-like serine/threonine-protein kinase